MPPVRESLVGMGWVEVREGRDPRACWWADGRKVRRTCATVDECEQVLREVEGCAYRSPEERQAGRPAGGVRGHEPSITQYSKYKCRGAGCKKVWSEYQQAKREQKRALFHADPAAFKHGIYDTYCLGCACEECIEAGRVFREGYRDRRAELHRAKRAIGS